MIERTIIISSLSFKNARECYESMDQVWLLRTKQALETDLKHHIDTEQGVVFASVRINIIDDILEEQEEKWKKSKS